MSEIPCPYCESTCKIPNDNEEKIECPNCGSIFIYIQNSESHGTIDYRPSPEINDRCRQMSELKAFEVTGKALFGRFYTKKVYDKDEADKVIAEKDKEIADLVEKNKRLANKDIIMASEAIKDVYKELRHQKYKRCLDKAEMCQAKYDEEDTRVIGFGMSLGYVNKEMKYWERWRKRWLKIAEQFKEAK